MSFARPVTGPPNVPGPSRIMRRIGLWGAPGSGKTTFLAALNVAVLRGGHNWRIFGVDDEATAFLSESTAMLTERREFPEATTNLEHRSWVMMGETEVRYGSRWRRSARSPARGSAPGPVTASAPPRPEADVVPGRSYLAPAAVGPAMARGPALGSAMGAARGLRWELPGEAGGAVVPAPVEAVVDGWR